MSDDVLYESHGAVRLITINRPAKMNSLDFDANDALIDAWKAFDGDDAQSHRKSWLAEAARAGNSTDDILADWVDFQAAGAESEIEDRGDHVAGRSSRAHM